MSIGLKEFVPSVFSACALAFLVRRCLSTCTNTAAPYAGLVDMDMAAMTSALAASPRAHLLSASYSPLRASALQAGAAASGEASSRGSQNQQFECH